MKYTALSLICNAARIHEGELLGKNALSQHAGDCAQVRPLEGSSDKGSLSSGGTSLPLNSLLKHFVAQKTPKYCLKIVAAKTEFHFIKEVAMYHVESYNYMNKE